MNVSHVNQSPSTKSSSIIDFTMINLIKYGGIYTTKISKNDLLISH